MNCPLNCPVNCQDISLLLDDRDVRRLVAAETVAVKAHLDRCDECARAWRVHERLLARTMPETASGLGERVWQSLRTSAARNPLRRRFGRTALLGFVLGGAAAAMTALQLRELAIGYGEDSAPTVTNTGADRTIGSASATAAAVNRIHAAPSDADEASAVNDDALRGTSIENAARRRLIVLPTRHENASSSAVVAVDATYDVIVGVLRSKPGLEIVEVTETEEAAPTGRMAAAAAARTPGPPEYAPAAPGNTPAAAESTPRVPPPALDDRPYAGPWMFIGPAHSEGGENLAIARWFGGDYVMRVTNELPAGATRSTDDWSISVQFDGPLGGGRAGASIEPAQDSTPESVGVALADNIYAYLFAAYVRDEHESLVIDAGAAESERVAALRALSRNSGFSDAVLAGAIELGRSAASAETRRQVWELLGRSGHPAAVQPLTDALLFDAEAEVRREAADALFRHLDAPVVRSVLESASINDPSPVVRLQAKWQYMTNAGRRAHVATALRDRSLTPEERMTPLRVARRAVLSFDMDLRLDDELRSLVVEAASESSNPAVKKAAIDELFDESVSGQSRQSADRAFVGFLLEALDETELDVRASAIRALRPHIAVPGVRRALEDARATEPDSRVRTAIDDML